MVSGLRLKPWRFCPLICVGLGLASSCTLQLGELPIAQDAADRDASLDRTAPDRALNDARRPDGQRSDARQPDFLTRDSAPRPDTCRTRFGPVSATAAPAPAFHGPVCNPGNARVEDGAVAGLACGSNFTYSVDGITVTACLLLDYGSTMQLRSTRIVARAAETACGDSCEGSVCDPAEGYSFELFTSVDGSGFTHVNALGIGASLASSTIPLERTARYLLICRNGGGPARRNLEVDYAEVIRACS